MKDFICTLKQTFRVSLADFAGYALIPLAGGVIGIIMVLIILVVDGTGEEYGQLGTMFVEMFGVIIMIFGGVFSVQSEFNLAISMGKTRKSYVPAKYLVLVSDMAVILVIVYMISRIEDALYPAIYPMAVCEFNADIIFSNSGLVGGILFGIPALILFLGVMLMKFSAKIFWVIWAVWMFGVIGVPRIMTAVQENPESMAGKVGLAVVRFWEGLTVLEIWGIVIVVVVVVMGLTRGLFRRQRVTA